MCSLLLCLSSSSLAQSTYTWQGTVSTSWSEPTNWAPARVSPASNDVLVFDGGVTPTTTVAMDYTTTQTIGQIRFSNAIRATLCTNLIRELIISGNPSAIGLAVESGVTLQLIGTHTSGDGDLIIRLVTGVPARISGRLELKGSATTSSAHQLLSTTPGAIEFLSGSYVQPGSKFTGFLFGSGTANKNSVLFRNGATYEQATGSTPFGSNTTFQIVNFEPYSQFLYTATGNTVALSGRTYGKLEINTNRTLTLSTYSTYPSVIQSDLVITAGQVTINTSNVELRGNLLINGGGLAFNLDANNSPITFKMSGTTAQRIGGTAAGTFTLPSNTTLALENPAGLTLERPMLANGPVTLTQGMLTTTSTNRLTLGTTATITGSASSFVQGPLVRQSSAAGSLFFPIGKGATYRPLTLTVATAPAGTTSYMAEQREGRHTDRTFLGNLKQVSAVRSYSVIPSPVPVSGAFAGTITLSFGADDGVTDPSAPSLVVAKTDGSGWTNTGRTAYSATSLTSDTFTDFSDFAMGSTSTTANPLPVTLTSFSGNHQPDGVQLRWTTASEKQNAYFEVERRTDNQVFSTLTRVAGRGNSTTATTYSFMDSAPQTGKMYYRLRQVDTDGTATYSSVIVVTVPSQSHTISLYPNPTAHQLRVTGASEGGQYRVVNAQGTVKLSGQITPGLCLNVENLPAGFYRLELLQGRSRTMHSFVRSRD
ncbi:Por secretion system C-terminal sorting domain-containing protein [Hymenobacter gelipurpurascens]|uniref:Por secretion system C-terminal sorting domain-containing protein n=1 Tax=Hymenobacter gelipurpurascens TaxID=89968 RepID=A0A212T321_9BACT|nr:T9SS type A sorting domain-containing protein [Hymenobacter gelipurpurascens]SNC60433.1 Por secretion system C-terminal sorting domain-containing protein [Hymenobacter gelipurpurascens]